jgi:hypothetical protein
MKRLKERNARLERECPDWREELREQRGPRNGALKCDRDPHQEAVEKTESGRTAQHAVGRRGSC